MAVAPWRSLATYPVRPTWSWRSRVQLKRTGRLDILVANAAVQLHKRDRPIHEQDPAAWDETQSINLRGAFLTCRAAVRQLLDQGQGGAIVIVSSVTAVVGVAPQNPSYTASKGGLVAFGRALAIQYAGERHPL